MFGDVPHVEQEIVVDGVLDTFNDQRRAFGLLAAEDTVTNLIFPGALGSRSESLGQNSRTLIGRYRQNLADSSSLGGLLTSRSGDDYENNVRSFLRLTIQEQTVVFAGYSDNYRHDDDCPDLTRTDRTFFL